MMVYQDQSKVAKFFRQAEQQGLVTSSSGEAGYFYAPTQKLVEMMLRTTQ
jgi:uncharacterized OB-fold protein